MKTLLTLILFGLATACQAANLTIPTSHPRLWFGNGARLAQAQARFATNPFTPAGGDIQYERALRGVLTANVGDCDLAADYLVAWLVENNGSRRDALRQQGEELLLIYDWCHDRFTPAEISTLVTRWNGYMDLEINDDFANQGSEANNYFTGRTRNLLLWGITSFHENARAQEFINQSLDTRYGTWFPSWYQDFGRGGVFPEGGDYGVVSLSYPIIAFASAGDFGYDAFALSPYYREAIYATLYGTTPGATTLNTGFTGGYLLFPFNDDENLHGGGVINARNYLGDFARYFGARDVASGNARHARAWLATTNAGRSWLFDALGGTGSAADFADLPLDYYAPGAQVFDLRSAHDASATQVHLQLGTPGGTEHRHYDAGSFQMWRKGRFLTRETAEAAAARAAVRLRRGGLLGCLSQHARQPRRLALCGQSLARVPVHPAVADAADPRSHARFRRFAAALVQRRRMAARWPARRCQPGATYLRHALRNAADSEYKSRCGRTGHADLGVDHLVADEPKLSRPQRRPPRRRGGRPVSRRARPVRQHRRLLPAPGHRL
ncbi:MAG: hypothetical protein IPH76_15690 [Xanthomonadales bacterium]|nr:hypothetical protein [Xanthomonadales bacterium]